MRHAIPVTVFALLFPFASQVLAQDQAAEKAVDAEPAKVRSAEAITRLERIVAEQGKHLSQLITRTERINEEQGKSLRRLEERLSTRERESAKQVKIFPLKNANAHETRSMIESLFINPSNLVASVRIQSDDRTNSLVVIATESELSIAESIIKTLDANDAKPKKDDVNEKKVVPGWGPLDVRVFALKEISPGEAKQLISNLMKMELESQMIRIEALSDTKSLIVLASKNELDKLDKLIKILEEEAARYNEKKEESKPASSSKDDARAKQISVRRIDSGEVVLYLGEVKTSESDLAKKLRDQRIKASDLIQVRADKGIAYDEMSKVLKMLSALGFEKIHLETRHAK